MDKIQQHPAVALDRDKPTSHVAGMSIEKRMEKNNEDVIDPVPLETESSLKAPDDNYSAPGGSRRWKKKKAKKIIPRRESRKLKKTQLSFSLFNFNETKYNTLKDNTGSESPDCDLGSRHSTKRNQSDGVKVIHLLCTCFWRAVDHRMYRQESE